MRNLNLIFETISLVLATRFLGFECQFISHINTQGFKGNFTFDLERVENKTNLVVKSWIEDVGQTDKNSKLYNTSQQIYLDWSVHSGTLDPVASRSCDDLGPDILQSLGFNSPIILNQPNSFSNSIDSSDLGSILWGRTVTIKISHIHLDTSEPQESDKKNVLNKPRISTPHVNVSSKPTFAPRVKPSISGKFKQPSSTPLPTPSSSSPSSPEPTNAKIEDVKPSAVENPLSDINSIIAKHYGKTKICSSIIDNREIKTAEAVFESQIAGKIVMRGNVDGLTMISTNLYHVKSKISTRHDWKLLASDILDVQNHEEKCKHLHILFDPNYQDDSGCKKTNTSYCKMGDLTRKHGQIQIAGLSKNTRAVFIDHNLPLSALDTSRSLYMVIYDVSAQNGPVNNGPLRSNILSCAEVRPVKPRAVEARLNMNGVRGSLKISQRYIGEPSIISYNFFGLEGNVRHLNIREVPQPTKIGVDNTNLCSSLGRIFDPFDAEKRYQNNRFTFDQIPVGNLSEKHGQLSVIDSEYEDHYLGEFMDTTVQLFGPNNVVGRPLAILKNNGETWVCATLNYIDEPMHFAAVKFYYPVVGQISFQQIANDPSSETGVLIDVYNPNGQKSSDKHNWMIHLKPTQADFYNWSERCNSVGDVFDPLQLSSGISNDAYNKQCRSSLSQEPLRCKVGDTATKSSIKISLPIDYQDRIRLFYSDMFLPLSGPHSIVGKSMVIYDESSPVQRGNRLACSTIKLIHPLRAVVKSWTSGPSIPSSVKGSIKFEQSLMTNPTNIKMDLEGFNGNVENYAIHNVWTVDDREFPCSNDSLYEVYDPFDGGDNHGLSPSAPYGSTATDDRIKVGDLSRKHGTLEGLQSVHKSYVDSNAPLFAPHSIIGRSVILRASVNDFRWVCGNVEFDYDDKKSRLIIGLASFDDPRSKVSGYVRFSQLEHKDGSLSDTLVQIDLKMQSDGIHEPETSFSHNWAVFVNQVGADAYISADEVRCIAAGFRWNPFLAQDNLDSYAQSCNPLQQMACAMGDLSSRHGSLILGPNRRRVVSDSNLPLTGNFSIMGRSLVIFDSKRPNVKLACANIMPDIHLKSNVVIKRTPSFTVAKFAEQMRSSLGATEWLMIPELKATKPVADGECIQMTIHLYGQKAYQIQSELNNLINLGTIRRSTPIGVQDVSSHYKLCRVGDSHSLTSASSSSNHVDQFLLCLVYCVIFINLLL